MWRVFNSSSATHSGNFGVGLRVIADDNDSQLSWNFEFIMSWNL